MIALLFSWVLISCIFYTAGRASIQLLGLCLSKEDNEYSPLDTILIGMCTTASIIAIFSLWIPANTMLLFALIFMCILYWLLNNKSISPTINKALDFIGAQPKLHLLVYAVSIVSIVMFSTLHPMMTDTLYYHYQNIMWNDQYAVVPGLANLQPRFAFNSSYFLLASTFGLKPLFGHYIFGVHTFCLAAIFVWVFYKIMNTQDLIKNLIAVLMITCLFVFYKLHITSVTTDFIPNLLICYLVIKVIYDGSSILKKPLLFFALSTFIFTLKVSCFAVLAIPLYILYISIRDKKIKDFSFFVFIGLFLVVPWITRTVILSGYVLFPFPYIDLFSFDWKIPIEYATEQKNFIQSFARYPNNTDIDAVLAMSISEWFPIWWKSDMYYFNPIANRFFFFATLITIPLGAIIILKKKMWQEYKELVIIWSATVLGIVVWFFNAPDFRFIYSLILAQFFIIIFLLVQSISPIQNKSSTHKTKESKIIVALTIITIIFVASFSARWVYYQKGEDTKLSDLIRVPTSMEYIRTSKGMPPTDSLYYVMENGIKINRMSASDRDVLCLDYDLPCSADYVGGIEMRGQTLQDGFRCRPDAPHRLTY